MALQIPHIPNDIWEQPALQAAQVYLKHGNLIDVHHTRFQPRFDGDIPQIELLRSYRPFGVVNIRGLDLADIHHIAIENTQDLEMFHNKALSESRAGRNSLLKGAAVGLVSTSLGVKAVSHYIDYQHAENCLAHNEVMLVEGCGNLHLGDDKTQSGNEAAALGVGAAVLVGVAIVAFRSAAKHFKASKIEFTKAALAASNAQNCENYLAVDGHWAEEIEREFRGRNMPETAPPAPL